MKNDKLGLRFNTNNKRSSETAFNMVFHTLCSDFKYFFSYDFI
jgi:hypothetical protein